jgi:DNA-binding response OmpR family regulator
MATTDTRAGATDKGSILLIDDAADFRRIYRHFLSREGYRIQEAEDGEKAWQLLRTSKPDLILLDLVLPKKSGFDVLRQIRAEPATKDIPVVILSGLGNEENIKRGVELGATYHSVKGVESIRDVLRKISLSLAARPPSVESAPRYRVGLRDGAGDAAQLQQTLRLDPEFRCADCRTETVLELESDAGAADGHWFKAHFICPNCQKAI